MEELAKDAIVRIAKCDEPSRIFRGIVVASHVYDNGERITKVDVGDIGEFDDTHLLFINDVAHARSFNKATGVVSFEKYLLVYNVAQRYISEPIEVKAIQYTGLNAYDISEFVGFDNCDITLDSADDEVIVTLLVRTTNRGLTVVNERDYIVGALDNNVQVYRIYNELDFEHYFRFIKS